MVVGLGCLVRLGAHQSFIWPKGGIEEADQIRKLTKLRRRGRKLEGGMGAPIAQRLGPGDAP